MRKSTRWVLGFDIGDRRSTGVLLDTVSGEERELKSVAMTRKGVEGMLAGLPGGTRVILETGTHSGWVANLGRRMGVDVVVADARRLDAVTKNVRKCDLHDAALLAHMGASDLDLLRAVYVRDGETQAQLSVLRMRSGAVAARTLLINTARGIAKSLGERLPSGSTTSFAKKVTKGLPERLEGPLAPILPAIADLSRAIAAYDAAIESIGAQHEAVARMRKVDGVGPLTAVCFLLTVADPHRFEKARDVGAWVGLVPRRAQSSTSDPQLRITKAGDTHLRRLLVQCAHHILGPFGKECDLRTWGLKVAATGGKRGRNVAVTAVARKLAVILLKLWQDRADYEPFHASSRRAGGTPQVSAVA